MNKTTCGCLVSAFLVCLLSASKLSAQSVHPAPVMMTLNPDEVFMPGTSVLWSPAGQAAWDQMRMYHGVKAIEFDRHVPIADVLNRFVWDAMSTLPPNTVVYGGEDSEKRREEIRAEITKKAGANAAQMIGPFRPPGKIGPDHYRIRSALFVSCLAHAPKFPSSFSRDAKPKTFTQTNGQTLQVRGFGVERQEAANFGDAFQVLSDDLAGGYVLRLPFMSEDKAGPDCLVLAKKPGIKTLGEGMAYMRASLKTPLPALRTIKHQGQLWRYTAQLTDIDHFWMPKLKATIACDYHELIGETYLRYIVPETGFQLYWKIIEAQQLLNFSLDEKGAMTQMVFKVSPDFEAMGGLGGGEVLPQGVTVESLPEWPKGFKLDGPFLAALWRKGADWPYLAVWVDSEDVIDLK